LRKAFLTLPVCRRLTGRGASCPARAAKGGGSGGRGGAGGAEGPGALGVRGTGARKKTTNTQKKKKKKKKQKKKKKKKMETDRPPAHLRDRVHNERRELADVRKSGRGSLRRGLGLAVPLGTVGAGGLTTNGPGKGPTLFFLNALSQAESAGYSRDVRDVDTRFARFDCLRTAGFSGFYRIRWDSFGNWPKVFEFHGRRSARLWR